MAAIPPGLVRELDPFVTISSGRAGIDPAVAPPALLAALSGAPLAEVRALIATPYPNSVNRTDPRLPLPFLQIRPHGTLLVHAEATMPGGAIAVREVLIDVRRPFGAPVVIKEVRHGAARYGAALAALLRTNGTAIPAC